MRLESENGVRIEAPIPGKNLVGIEVPNKVKTMVGLRDILESESFRKTSRARSRSRWVKTSWAKRIRTTSRKARITS